MARTLALTIVFLALTAPAAMAVEGHDGGEGWLGETNDAMVTNAGFLLIGFFPLFILVMSLIQWKLEKRKDASKEAAKARAARSHERQGY
jgi:hypothetical protein